MKPTSTEVKSFLDETRKNPDDIPWIEHTLAVGDTAALIAAALCERGHNLDPERLRTLGYLHDIGKLGSNYGFLRHVIDGYVFMKRQDYPEDYCAVSLTHSFICNDPELTLSSSIFAPQRALSAEHMQTLADIIPDGDSEAFLRNYITNHNFTLEDKIICLCDMICLDRPTNLEVRLIDVISRHGTWENTQKVIIRAMEIKHEFDEMLGEDLYNLWS